MFDHLRRAEAAREGRESDDVGEQQARLLEAVGDRDLAGKLALGDGRRQHIVQQRPDLILRADQVDLPQPCDPLGAVEEIEADRRKRRDRQHPRRVDT